MIASEGEQKSAKALMEAARIMASSPSALQLRQVLAMMMVTNMVTNMVANMHRLTFSMRGCLRDLQVGSPASSAEPPFDISLM